MHYLISHAIKYHYERHEYIAKLLMMLGVDNDIVYHVSGLIEHDLSLEIEAIKKAFNHALFNK